MFSRILTDLERRQVKAYLKANGERTHNVHVLVSRSRAYLPHIKSDLELLERFLATYERSKK
jgi:hypothetical protein